MRIGYIGIFFLTLGWASAQQRFSLTADLKAELQERNLSMPFAGGINAAQIQTMDLTGDGEEEYVIWDINAGMLSVIREHPDGRYEHLPQASYQFPADISGFLVLADFDGDGRKDLFTGSPFGIKAYKNITPATASHLQWEEAQAFLRLDNGSNVTANSMDIPLIMDLDGDGDLDLLTFNFASGDYLEFYRNTSMERKGVADIDGFASAQIRWGEFEFCSCGTFTFGITCAGAPIASLPPTTETARLAHAGGHSILYHDLNGDGVRDLLMGQDLCRTLYFLPNKGTDSSPVFDEFLLELPQTGPLPEFPVFHAAHLVKDHLIITSNSSETGANSLADFGSSVYRYALSGNVGLTTRRFLQDEMIDLGENSRPFFMGNNANGSLVVTSNYILEGRSVSRATRFVLEGGVFRATDDDYLQLSQLELREMNHQSFKTSKGVDWHIVTGDRVVDGIPEKIIRYLRHARPEEAQESQVPGFTLCGVDDLKFFSHNNEDYLLVGRQTGELLLFQANFEGNGLQLQLKEREFLGFSDNPVNRNLAVAVVAGTSPTLLAVDQRGILRAVTDFMENPETITVQVQVGENQWVPTKLGRNTWMTPVPSPFGSTYDVILGNRAGGLLYYRGVQDAGNDDGEGLQINVYPNPAQAKTKVISSKAAVMDIVHLSGKVVLEKVALSPNQPIELFLTGMASGVYIVRLTGESREVVHKKLIVYQ
nr:T9SS type A sorting domain-containing protein [Cytophagales bacterium]